MENTQPQKKPTPAELELLSNYATFGQNQLLVKFFETFGSSYIDYQDGNGWTPLMYAACNSETDTLTILLEHGASLDLKSNAGNTAAMIANQNNRSHIVTFLMNWQQQQQYAQELEKKRQEEEKKRLAHEKARQAQTETANARINILKQKKASAPCPKRRP